MSHPARPNDPDDIFALARAIGVVHEDDATGWEADALCSRVGTPDRWFPAKGSMSGPARSTCARCTVREPCLQTALREGLTWGIWGGLGQLDRKPLHLAYDAEHGLDRTYGRAA